MNIHPYGWILGCLSTQDYVRPPEGNNMQGRSRSSALGIVSSLLSLVALVSAVLFCLPLVIGTDYIPTPWLVLAVMAVLLPPPSLVLGVLAIRANRYEPTSKASRVLSWGGAIIAGLLMITCTFYFGFGLVINFLLNFSQFFG